LPARFSRRRIIIIAITIITITPKANFPAQSSPPAGPGRLFRLVID
jgi:hypothetical protein